MIKIHPSEYPYYKLDKLMLGGVTPRPIALASTIDADGNRNLSPFSCFNTFGVNPSTLVFSPSRRGTDNTTKHTFDNLKEIPEVVINTVTYSMVQQTSLSSTVYPKGVDEFVKAGFTPIESVSVRPFRVKESPFQMECRVRDIIETSGQPGSANLVICEVVTLHIDENIMDENGVIDPHKLDIVGRLGANNYVRASGEAVFQVEKPLTTMGIGVDELPESVRFSKVLTGNDLGKLGNLEVLPDEELLKGLKLPAELKNASVEAIHHYAQKLIIQNRIEEALLFLVAFG
ncbi:MAG: flavin reductase family protein [Bacteroidales bacterium]|nr:flavin reductase family protein [Bacteroidales bacterium]